MPPQPGFVGLREFYPTRARGSNDKSKAKTKKRGRAKESKPAPKKEAKSPKKSEVVTKESSGKQGTPNKEIPIAVQVFMSDKQLHSPEEIAEAVSKQLGRSVKVIAIRGSLSSKKRFEQADGKFRLIG